MAGLDDVAAQTLELDQHERFSLLCLSLPARQRPSHEEGLPYGLRMQASAETPTALPEPLGDEQQPVLARPLRRGAHLVRAQPGRRTA
jgi:hypothetical protein